LIGKKSRESNRKTKSIEKMIKKNNQKNEDQIQ